MDSTFNHLAVPPYNDDYDTDKNYYSVLYKPGVAVQARELNQSQTILQDQIGQLGQKFMVPGDVVIPGEFSYGSPIAYVKLEQITQGAKAKDFIGYTLTGKNSGVKAKVIHAEERTSDDDITLFVSYKTSGNTRVDNVFKEQEILESNTPNKYTAVVGVDGSARPVDSPALGFGCIFKVTPGAYFINNYIVRNYAETITLSKYTTVPNVQVGFVVTNSFVNSNQDRSLLDNSQGHSNFAAPGADRLKIALKLAKLPIDATLPNFIRLATIVQGNLQGSPTQTIKWDWLYDILARRTFNESGNYIVKDFVIQPMEYVNENEYNGLYNPIDITATGSERRYPPIPGSGSLDTLTFDEASSKYVLNVSPGLAYVQGYEVGYNSGLYKFSEKARDTRFRSNATLNVKDGSYFNISKVSGLPDIENIKGQIDAIAMNDIVMYRNFIDGYIGEATDPNGENAPTPQNLGNPPQTTQHIICDSAIGNLVGNSITLVLPSNRQVLSKSVVIKSEKIYKRGDRLGSATVCTNTVIPPLPAGILRPRYFYPENVIPQGGTDNTNSFYTYESGYRLGVMANKYFTYLSAIADPETKTNWKEGEIVIGKSSGATGILEKGSYVNKNFFNGMQLFILSNVVGEFIEGENIYQGEFGSDQTRLFDKGEIAGFKFIEGGELDKVDEIKVSVLNSEIILYKNKTPGGGGSAYKDFISVGAGLAAEISLTTSGRRRLIEFVRGKIGQSVLPKINYTLEAKINTTKIKGYVFLPSFIIKNSTSNVKSFYSKLSDNESYNDFSADVSTQSSLFLEKTIVANGGTFSGRKGENYLTCDNFSGDVFSELEFGDIISFTDDGKVDSFVVTKQVLFVTSASGYGNYRVPSYIYFTTTLDEDVSSRQVERIRTRNFGDLTDNLIYQLPQKVIKTLESTPLNTNINYQVFREFSFKYNGGTELISITTTLPNEQFIDDKSKVSITLAKALLGGSNVGRIVAPEDIDILDDGKQLNIKINAIVDGYIMKIIAPVSVTDAKAKQKILRKYEGLTVMKINPTSSSKSVISLGRTDVFSVSKVELVVYSDNNKTTIVSRQDILNNYVFDDGQRDNYYDISRLILKQGAPMASSPTLTGTQTWGVEVTAMAFDHTGDGDFFTVDSYTHDKGVSYNKIPVYFPSSSIGDQQNVNISSFIELRDCIDFRPSVNTKTPNQSKIPFIEPNTDEQDAINFRNIANGGNADVPRFMIPGSILYCDIEYYLGRTDSVFLDKSGDIKIKKGISDINPKTPDDESTGLRIYDLHLPPYTFSAKDIFIKKYNYRRYTMADISDLDNRISKVENYVTLSMLEQSALNTQVRDSVTGLDRFKNGFVVDSFRDHSNGNTTSPEYRCSVDPRLNHLRPPHYTEQVTLIESNQLDEQRSNNLYTKSGSIFTLPYEKVDFISNPYATRSTNLQPFSVFVYDGEIVLDPPIDTWQEVRVRDSQVIEENSLYNAMLDMTNSLVEMGMGTVWGDWETNSRNMYGAGIISFDEARRRGLSIQDGGGSLAFANRPVRVTDIASSNQTRTEFKIAVNPETSTTVQTSQGERVVDVQVSKTMRTYPVFFQSYRLKPNTKYYAFFDNINVSDWVSSDNPDTISEDGTRRFTSNPNTNPKGFGKEIITDDVGTITGLFLIPNGHSPVNGSTYTDNLVSIPYNTNSITRSFNTGTKTFRLSTSPTNENDADAYAETNFTASGVIVDKQDTIISTRVPNVGRVSTGRNETRELFDGGGVGVAYDPVAQSFLVDDNNPDGVFVTELEVFFETKDDREGVSAYLVTTSGQVPTTDIIPFSLVHKESDSILRVKCNLAPNINTETLLAGITVVGKTSGARGIVKTNVVFNRRNISNTRNVSNTVYNVILSNYFNEFIAGEEIIPEVAPKINSTFTIVDDELVIESIDVRNTGRGYLPSSTVTFSAPDLPGGVTPTAKVIVAGNELAAVTLLTSGSGYTSIPKVTVSGGNDGKVIVRTKPGKKAVSMGVATSSDATASTRFKFESPVYLLGKTNYAFVLKSPNSLEYKAFISKMGENIINTETRVVQQPLLGSIFRSQNGALWTEDQTEDIMFTLYRANFDVKAEAHIELENAPIKFEKLDLNPIEINKGSGPLINNVFGSDPRVVKVYQKSHGHVKDDYVLIQNITRSVGNIRDQINGIHKVIEADMNFYTIRIDTGATSSIKGGGANGIATANRPFEVLDLRTGSIQFKNTQSSVEVRSTSIKSISGYGKSSYVLSPPVNVSNEISYYFIEPQVCGSYINEAKYSGSNNLQNRRSLLVTISMSTNDPKLSPVYDLDRTNAILVHSLVNNPKNSNKLYGIPVSMISLKEDKKSVLSSIKSDIINLKSDKANHSLDIRNIDEKNGEIYVVDEFLNNLSKSSKFLSINGKELFDWNDIERISPMASNDLISEVKTDGSSFAKWISREFKLENDCDGLELKMSAIMYESDSIRVYYKPRLSGYDGSLSELNWIPFNPGKLITTRAGVRYYSPEGLCNDNDRVRIRSSDIIDPRQLLANDWTEFTWSAQNISKFISFSLKIVMTASNPAKVPLIDDIRVIASE